MQPVDAMGGLSSMIEEQDDYNCKVELALTSDGRTIVRYHPSVDVPYEHTEPLPRRDPVRNNEETHGRVLKSRLEEKSAHFEQGSMIGQLSLTSFTTKHRWCPCGQYHRRRKKVDPPKDRWHRGSQRNRKRVSFVMEENPMWCIH
ncbi:39S ribosomal protein L42, mitochondrial [Tupaia chinensis]|uniref:Large ribosomal subunit protein mL42 n=1 Tax=Tupaia chinensis TaxID=246437 RepID=L9K017_TUPCH|nr:39S ribosomal protein L42, mitochondrial [Tupaia chinensis]